jgi:hypothetical protein
MMHGYKDFAKDVNSILEGLVLDFDLVLISESTTDVVFESPRCVIGFFTEYDYVQFCFKEKETDKWMFLGPYFKALYPKESINIRQAPDDLDRVARIRFDLEEKLRLIKKYCIPILKGDFSWENNYKL